MSAGGQHPSRVSKSRNWLFTVLPWLILTLGAAATGLQWSQVKQREARVRAIEFSQHLHELAYGLEHRLKANEQVLRGVVGLFVSSQEVNRKEFEEYVRAINVTERYAGIQGIGFSEFIPPSGKAAHTTRLRAEGFPNYEIRPPGERPAYSAIVYLEPFDWRNQRAFGFDMYSEPVRQAAMARARDEGVAALSGKVTLVQETESDVQAGVLLYVPIYRHGARIESLEERQAAFRGWAYSPLRMRDMISTFIDQEHPEHSRRLALRIYDGNEASPEALLFSSSGTEQALDVPDSIMQIKVAGRTWTLAARPLPGYSTESATDAQSHTILLAGIAVTLLLALLSGIMARAHRQVAHALQEADQANRSLAEQENLLRTIYDSSSVAIFVVDHTGRITHANQRMAEMFLCSLQQLIGSEYVAHIHPSEREVGRSRMLQLIAQEIPAVNLERRYWRDDGSEFWGLLTGRPIRNAEGSVRGLVGVIADITQRKQGEAAMQLARTVFENSVEGIIVTDAHNQILSVNPAFSQITGYREEDVIGRDPKVLNSGRQSPEFYREMWQALQKDGRWEGELWNRRKDGNVYPEMLSISQVQTSDGSISNYIAIFQDITARRQADDRIRHLAHHDYLTGLPNRAFFVDHVAQALALARRYERRLGVLFMDLDRFKPINDQYGHDAGDAVLCEIAGRLLDAVRESDMVCRQGGDEFLVLVPEAHGDDQLEELATKLLTAIRQPIAWGEQSFVVSVSIGIATYPECGGSVDALIQSADSAMYVAKANPEKPIALGRGIPS